MLDQTRRFVVLVATATAVAACGGGSVHRGPAITSIKDMSINQDTTATVPISVTDNQASMSSLRVSAAAANGSLILPQGIVIQDNNGVPTLYVTPAEDAVGQSAISVSVTDDKGGNAQQSFNLTVNAVNIQFSTLAQGVLAKAENDTPAKVSGYTISEDADISTAYDALVQ